MNTIRTLEAIDDAVRNPSWCACGEPLALVVREDDLWLSCPVFDEPSRLPQVLREPVRRLLHDRTFVVCVHGEALGDHAARPMAA